MTKSSPRREEERENRIIMEVVVDAYNESERAMGWYYYLENQIQFPFTATCIAARAISPLRVKNEVEVTGMADEGECEHEVFVTMLWENRNLAVPLSQLKPISNTSKETKQAVEDWHYWVRMGYRY